MLLSCSQKCFKTIFYLVCNLTKQERHKKKNSARFARYLHNKYRVSIHSKLCLEYIQYHKGSIRVLDAYLKHTATVL